MTAAPVVPLDLLCASGTSYFGARSLPYVPGVQGVGEVVAGGDLAPGTRVFVATRPGWPTGRGARRAVRRPAVAVVALPREQPTSTTPPVAALGLSGVAAWQALAWRAGLRPGESVARAGCRRRRRAGGDRCGAGPGGGTGRRRLPVREDRRTGAGAGPRRRGGDRRARPGRPHGRAPRALPDGADVVLDPVFGWVAEAAPSATGPRRTAGQPRRLGLRRRHLLLRRPARSRSLSLLGYTNNALTAEPASRGADLRRAARRRRPRRGRPRGAGARRRRGGLARAAGRRVRRTPGPGALRHTSIAGTRRLSTVSPSCRGTARASADGRGWLDGVGDDRQPGVAGQLECLAGELELAHDGVVHLLGGGAVQPHVVAGPPAR